jgi:hypothetical protein
MYVYSFTISETNAYLYDIHSREYVNKGQEIGVRESRQPVNGRHQSNCTDQPIHPAAPRNCN